MPSATVPGALPQAVMGSRLWRSGALATAGVLFLSLAPCRTDIFSSSKTGEVETTATATRSTGQEPIITVGKRSVCLYPINPIKKTPLGKFEEGFDQTRSIRLDRKDLEDFRDLAKKFTQWSALATKSDLIGIRKSITFGNLSAVFETVNQDDGNGQSAIRCFLNLQGKWSAEDIQWFIKNLDRIPVLDTQIEKADKLLK